MLKAVQIQYSKSSAGSAALRLHTAFLKSNIDSSIISLLPDIITTEKIKNVGRGARMRANIDYKIQSYLRRNNKKEFGLFSYPILGTNIEQLEEVKNADIIYIHWALHGFLNLRSIEKLAQLNKPVILFMHDMWWITGGCHYSFECEKYKSKCTSCQYFLGNNKKDDLSTKEFNKKLELYSKYDNLYFVSPSKWLYNCAQESLLTRNKPLFCIPNVLDDQTFKSFNKEIAKNILNIPKEKTVIAFGAMSLQSPYKGWAYLKAALELLSIEQGTDNIVVLLFGSSHNKAIADAIPFQTHFVGYLQDEYSLAVVYNASNVFVAPSLADNLPTTILESLNCGTPVVGFDVGGIPDMIRHKENGYLAKYKDSTDLAEGIKYCLQNNIKGYALPDFAPANVLQKHLDLHNSLKLANIA
jgi:glycosyltransferase involved in cell wall biosynthesis